MTDASDRAPPRASAGAGTTWLGGFTLATELCAAGVVAADTGGNRAIAADRFAAHDGFAAECAL